MTTTKRAKPADRRAYVRRAVRQVCQTAVPGLGIVPCIITDYCPAGLFLRFSARQRELDEVKQGENVAIAFAAGENVEKNKALGVIARVTPVGLGIRFDALPIGLLHTLEAVAQSQNQADQSVQYLTPGVPELLIELAARARCFARTCMGDFAVRASMTLSSRALNVTDDDVMNGLYAARATLKEHEADLLDNFPAALEDACLDLTEKAAPKSDLRVNVQESASELVLSNDTQFGHWLSVSELAAKADARYPVQLFDLGRRLNTLANRVLEPADNPFSPLAVAQLFSEKIADLNLSAEAYEVIYGAFAKAVIIPWEQLTNELNELLVEHQVQPSISHGLDVWHDNSCGEQISENS